VLDFSIGGIEALFRRG